MSRISFALGVLVLPLALFSTRAQGLPQPDPGTAIVSGVVTLKGEPTCGATVGLWNQGSRSHNKYFVSTDANGRFRVTNVAAGMYWIYARAPNHILLVTFGTELDIKKPLDVAEGQKVENIALEVKRGGLIAGRITDSRGGPLIGEKISLHRLDKDGKPPVILCVSRCQTDDRGDYRIHGLPEGLYLVSVEYARDKLFFYPGMTSQSEAKAIEVAEESEAAGIDITLPDQERSPIAMAITGEVTVRLVTEDGVGLPNVKVNMTPILKNRHSISASGGAYLYTTDENGNFKTHRTGPENEPGFYWFRALHAGGYALKRLVSQFVGNDITLIMTKGGVITGRVTNIKGEPMIGAIIILVMSRDAEGKPPMREGLELTVATDDRGVYRFWGLTPGTYYVYTNIDLAGGCSNKGFATYRSSSTSDKSSEVIVRSGVETSDIDISYREN